MKASKEYIFLVFTIIFTISVITLIIGIGEILLRIYLNNKNITIVERPPILIFENGFRQNNPNIKGEADVYKANKKLGSFKYTIDEKGRRKTPQDETHPKKNAVIFLGCSYTFGYGVNDDETFPAQFAKINPGCVVLNYGKPANSPQEILILVSNPKFYAEIPNLPAIFVYLYIPHHLERLAGSWELIGSWGKKLPYIELKIILMT